VSTRERRRRATGILLILMILALCASPQFRSLVHFPDHVRLARGQMQEFHLRLPVSVIVRPSQEGILSLNGLALGPEGRRVALGGPLRLEPEQIGQVSLDFRLFDLIPLRRLKVDVVPPVHVTPGGHKIGVMLRSNGVVVVGYAAIRTADGKVSHPGRAAGVELGDAIVQIGSEEVTSEEHAATLFESFGRDGRTVRVVIRRRGRLLERELHPAQERETGRWRVGLYIRDGAAGIGTLTFVHGGTRRYGALGHMIADGETNQAIEVREGHLVEAVVTHVEKGQRGKPGEQYASFLNEDEELGTIEKNTRFGIFGTMTAALENPLYDRAVPVAMSAQVREGPAEIITVVDGQQLERFTVEIVRLMRQPTADGKNMILKITDPRLLSKTGGIVQGMSGSPILQGGRMIGAVTHVFVNDPARGYGVLIEYMLQESGILHKIEDGPGAVSRSGAPARRVPALLSNKTE
jgi:stage IV sporulation protein B